MTSRHPTASPVPDRDVLLEQQRVAVLLRSLCAVVAPDLVPPDPVLRPGPRPATLDAAATVVRRDHPEGHATLSRLAEALTGWQRRLAPGRVARLEARLDGRVVTATYAGPEQVLVLSVSSVVLAVTREQSQRLRGRGLPAGRPRGVAS